MSLIIFSLLLIGSSIFYNSNLLDILNLPPDKDKIDTLLENKEKDC